MIRFVALFVVLVGSWLLWSGFWDPNAYWLVLLLGFASCVGVLALTMRMQGGDFQQQGVGFWIRLVLYIPWIIWEITKANIDVAKCIIAPSIWPISPHMIRVKASQKTAVGQTLYANSITLTPGTISLDIRNNVILVHALTNGTAEGLQDGSMDAMCTRVEGSS